MRTQCERIYSALPTQCQRICKGRCVDPCDSDASPESRVQRTDLGLGLDSPNPSVFVGATTPAREVWHHLTAGLGALSLNDQGRRWPNPDRATLRRLLATHDADLCTRAAREAREIVMSQDRAPNITALFEKKLAELAEVRSVVRESIGDVEFISAGEGESCR